MVRLRPPLVRVHRWAGLLLAGYLAIAGITGSVLAFHHEIDAWLNPELFLDPEPAPAPDLTRLATAIEEQRPLAQVRSLRVGERGDEAVLAWVEPRDPSQGALGYNQVFVSGGSGLVLGVRHWGAVRVDRAHLVPFLYRLHYALHLPNPWALWFTGALALIWLLDCFVGFYLTLPPSAGAPTRSMRQRWAAAWQVKWRAGTARVTFDLHRAGGLWLWPVLAVVAFSGAYLNLDREVFRPIVGLFSTTTPYPTERAPRPALADASPRLTFGEAAEAGRRALPARSRDLAFRRVALFPKHDWYLVGFEETGRAREALRVRFQQVVIDARSGEPAGLWGYDNGTAADKLRGLQLPLHNGAVLGLFGRLIVCLSGLVVAVLSITGVLIWWRKAAARRRSDARSRGLREPIATTAA